MPVEEVLVPFPAPRAKIPPVYGVRGTVLVTSLRALKARNLYDAYMAKLDAKQRQNILSVAAATWVPLDVAIAHYAACNALELPKTVIEDIGSEAGRFINETVVGVMVRRVAREAGASPWLAFGHADKLTGRMWQGSGISIIKVGPKEARLEWVGQPLAALPYFRIAYKAFVHGIATLFCDVVFVRDIPALCSDTTLTYRCSWV